MCARGSRGSAAPPSRRRVIVGAQAGLQRGFRPLPLPRVPGLQGFVLGPVWWPCRVVARAWRAGARAAWTPRLDGREPAANSELVAAAHRLPNSCLGQKRPRARWFVAGVWLSVAALAGGMACGRQKSRSEGALPLEAPAAAPSRPLASSSAGLARTPSLNGEAFEERRVEREHMVRAGIEREGVSDPRVLAAMRRVPRHRFVPGSERGRAYANHPLPIGWGQTISQPSTVAFMTEAVAPKPSDRCLEIGTGSGYQAAILAELCGRTYSIEYLPTLAEFAKKNLTSLGYHVELRTGDGYRGWPEAAPFDVIVVTAAPEQVPSPLLDQLALGGRLVIPVGPQGEVQQLELFVRRKPGREASAFERTPLADVRFVPFLGEEVKR